MPVARGEVAADDRGIGDILERLARNVRVENGCKRWTLSHNGKGYGFVSYRGKQRYVHILAWQLAHGPIPNGVEVDHSCHNRDCIELSHLRLRTHKQNAENRKGAQANSKTGIRGVSFHKASGKWIAQVKHHGKGYHCGLHETIEAAAEAAASKRAELFT